MHDIWGSGDVRRRAAHADLQHLECVSRCSSYAHSCASSAIRLDNFNKMIHCNSAYPAHLRSFRGSLTLNQRGTLCSSPHHQTCNSQHYSRVPQAQRMVTCAAAVRDSPPAQQRQQGGPTKATTTPSDGCDGFLALKEWAVTCAALASGQQTVVLRKGGIREPAFVPLASEFLLFPTSFHSGAELVKPHAAEQFAQELQYEPKEQELLTVEVAAEVTGAWSTADPAVLAALDEFHVWTPDYLEQRLRWRQRQPITVLELRCRRLQAPLTLPNSPDLWGCFSWVSLPAAQHAQAGGSSCKSSSSNGSSGTLAMDVLLEGAVPVMTDEDFAQQARALRAALDDVQGVQEVAICHL